MTNTLYDIMLELQGPCNYRCWYCVGPGTGSPYPLKLHELEVIQAFYGRLGDRPVRTTTYCRGTEPAIHPQTRELVSIIAPHGEVVIRTNFSKSVREWLPGPNNVRLAVTIHPEAEQDMDNFIQRLLEAQDEGYTVTLAALVLEGDRQDLRDRLEAGGVRYPLTVGKIQTVRLPDTQPELVGKKRAPKEVAPPPAPYPAAVSCMAGVDSCAILYRNKYGDGQEGTRICRCGNAAAEIEEPLAGPTPCTVARAGSKFCRKFVVAE